MVAIPSKALLSGIVKAVPSGDTIIVMKQAAAVTGPPPEMRLTLSSLKAPSLSRDATSDEPYAWASREYLRSRLIGRVVTFRIDYRVEQLSRVFATVYDGGVESVNLDVVHSGMSRVRRPANDSEQSSPEFEALIAAEESAASSAHGLHAAGQQPIGVARRLPAPDTELIPHEQLAAFCKGKSFNGIVEYIANGSALKIFVKNLPTVDEETIGDRILTICLSGVQCPGFRRQEGTDPSTKSSKPMPFALNAKFLTEVRLLHRDVKVFIEGVDRNGMLFATIVDPKGKMYIGEELLRSGFAKTVSWSIEFSSRAPSLRAAERYARDRQLAVWKGFKPSTTDSELFTGKCVEIVSGDTLVVLDDNTSKSRRISLASVRAERSNRGDRSSIIVGPAADAKEQLRKKLVGRRVHVKVEYTRTPAEESVRKDKMVFATIGREGDAKNADVALPLISQGLLTVVRHRGDEDTATNYEEYLERQKAAIEAKRGLHGNATSSYVRINNLTGPDAKKRSRDVLAGLQRNGPYKGVVEYVSSASRYRINLPTESMLITLALRVVRCPQSTRRSYAPDGSIREEVPGEAHGDEAADFAREMFMQRDVLVEVNNVDRVGAFLGNMYVISPSGEKVDASASLLSLGHGYLHESFDSSRDPAGSKYAIIEKDAKDAQKGLWKDYVENAKHSSDNAVNKQPAKKSMVAIVSEISFGGRVFVQNRDTYKSALASIEAGLKGLSLDNGSNAPASALRPGLIVAAKFNMDNQWYRARVLYVHKGAETKVDVRFIDYGNEDTLSTTDLRLLNGVGSYISAPPVATEVALAHVVVPDGDDPSGMAAGELLKELTYGKDITIAIESTEGNSKVIGDIMVPSAGSSDSTTGPVSVREQMLKTGLARLVRKSDRASKAAYKQYRPIEEIGIATRQYLWSYGEAYESDCDEQK